MPDFGQSHLCVASGQGTIRGDARALYHSSQACSVGLAPSPLCRRCTAAALGLHGPTASVGCHLRLLLLHLLRLLPLLLPVSRRSRSCRSALRAHLHAGACSSTRRRCAAGTCCLLRGRGLPGSTSSCRRNHVWRRECWQFSACCRLRDSCIGRCASCSGPWARCLALGPLPIERHHAAVHACARRGLLFAVCCLQPRCIQPQVTAATLGVAAPAAAAVAAAVVAAAAAAGAAAVCRALGAVLAAAGHVSALRRLQREEQRPSVRTSACVLAACRELERMQGADLATCL